MKRKALPALLLLLCALPLYAAPVLVVDEPEYDFAQAITGTTVTHPFELRNAGDTELRIESVKPSCGCTVAEFSKETLAPGETVAVTARLSLKGRRGRQRATITVKSNDPERPELRLRLRGEAIDPVQVKPSELHFGQVAPGAKKSRSTSITVAGEERFAIHEVQVGRVDGSDAPNAPAPFTASLKEREEGRGFEVTVTFEAGEVFGRTDAEVRLHTNSSRYPVLSVPVSAVVAGDLSVTPSSIALREGDSPVTRHLLIALRRDGEPVAFKIESIRVSAEHDAEIRHRGVGRGAYQVRLAGLEAGAALKDAALIIETDLKDFPRVQVPFRVERQRRAREGVEDVFGD